MEHVDLINRIIEAEQEAQRIAGQAREKLNALPQELKEQKEKLRREMYARADKRIAEVSKREEEWADEQIAELDARQKEELSALEKLFEEHRQEWAEKLFSLVTGR